MKANFTPSFDEERKFWEKNISHVIGIDEVGRGCFAGPVVVAGVIFDQAYLSHFQKKEKGFSWLHTIHDSKLLSKLVRQTLGPLIQNNSLHFSIAEISVPTINAYGIGKATFLGMQQVVKEIGKLVDKEKLAVLVDAFTIPDIQISQKPIIKGDQKSISIAAASIIAKVYRDALMENLAQEYTVYGFEKNMGYGTKKHREALGAYGLSAMHRTSFDLKKYTSASR